MEYTISDILINKDVDVEKATLHSTSIVKRAFYRDWVNGYLLYDEQAINNESDYLTFKAPRDVLSKIRRLSEDSKNVDIYGCYTIEDLISRLSSLKGSHPIIDDEYLEDLLEKFGIFTYKRYRRRVQDAVNIGGGGTKAFSYDEEVETEKGKIPVRVFGYCEVY